MFAKEVEEERQYRNMMDKVLDISVKEALIQVCRALMVLPFYLSSSPLMSVRQCLDAR